ncbi:hypothetical protein [Microbacterium sp.]|uniref:hypothetical protein n=1 Tax=Microbacterium sp. TaxID=51671 RepID=UPI0028118963|nr:hypothetical protein [Microbacterium sp.]
MPLLLSDRAVTESPVPIITAAEARSLGLRLSGHAWRRVRVGMYVERNAFEKLPPWQRYAVRVHAFARAHPDAALCLESAAVVQGLPLFGEPRDIHVFDPDRRTSRRFGDVVVHTSILPRSVERVRGVLVTRPLETVSDLARALPPAQALATADSAVSPAQGGGLRVEDLQAFTDSVPDRRGRARARWVWERADGRAESPAESISRAVIEWSGFETPELQREFRYDGHLDRVDFHFPSCDAIGESDGWQKYQLDDGASAARRLADEKRREDRLRRNGHAFARWDLADAWRVAPLVRALSSAGVQQTAPAQSAMLASFARTAFSA